MYSLLRVHMSKNSVLNYVKDAMRECGKTDEEISSFVREAESGNWRNLLYVSQDMVNKLNEESN